MDATAERILKYVGVLFTSQQSVGDFLALVFNDNNEFWSHGNRRFVM